jgi:hypothetical protein
LPAVRTGPAQRTTSYTETGEEEGGLIVAGSGTLGSCPDLD